MQYYSQQFQGIKFFIFRSLSEQHLSHGVFGRLGGVSPKPFDSLNLGFGVGDKKINVMENRARVKKSLGVQSLLSARQVHGNRVFVLQHSIASDLEVDSYDALVTSVPGVGLMIKQADCQAIFLFDPVRLAIGIVHSGWRGSVANIIGETVKTMREVFGTNPDDLLAAISPSLGPCCAEFVNFALELPEYMHVHQVKPTFFDFRAISIDQLQAAGVDKEKISVSGVCTVCNQDYFSYRREKATGRFASVIGLKI